MHIDGCRLVLRTRSANLRGEPMSTRPYLTAVQTAEAPSPTLSESAGRQTYDLAPILSVGEVASFLRLN